MFKKPTSCVTLKVRFLGTVLTARVRHAEGYPVRQQCLRMRREISTSGSPYSVMFTGVPEIVGENESQFLGYLISYAGLLVCLTSVP